MICTSTDDVINTLSGDVIKKSFLADLLFDNYSSSSSVLFHLFYLNSFSDVLHHVRIDEELIF